MYSTYVIVRVIKVLTFFGNITRSEHTSIEWRLAERQLQVKSYDSNSWFMDIRKICIKYDITVISCNAPQHNTKCCKVSSAFLHRLQVAEIRCLE
jgi:hypothetical protein